MFKTNTGTDCYRDRSSPLDLSNRTEDGYNNDSRRIKTTETEQNTDDYCNSRPIPPLIPISTFNKNSSSVETNIGRDNRFSKYDRVKFAESPNKTNERNNFHHHHHHHHYHIDNEKSTLEQSSFVTSTRLWTNKRNGHQKQNSSYSSFNHQQTNKLLTFGNDGYRIGNRATHIYTNLENASKFFKPNNTTASVSVNACDVILDVQTAATTGCSNDNSKEFSSEYMKCGPGVSTDTIRSLRELLDRRKSATNKNAIFD